MAIEYLLAYDEDSIKNEAHKFLIIRDCDNYESIIQ